MAPISKSKGASAKGSNKRTSKPSSSGPASKSRSKPSGPKPKPEQHKPKPVNNDKKKKLPPHKRYTAKELNIPAVNGIIPVGVQKPPNAKKGKNFVDDKESMNAIMALVMAEKEGNIESKMMRARQMEEVREAKKAEAEKRAGERREGMEERKKNIKDSKKRRKPDGETEAPAEEAKENEGAKRFKKKRVSFG